MGVRLRAVLAVADEMGTACSVKDLVALLPAGVHDVEVVDWLRAHPEIAKFDGVQVIPRGQSPGDQLGRRQRGQRYREAAEAFVNGPLTPVRRWVRCIGITGSTAYGEPRAGDDIDFLVIVRPGSVWVALAYLYLLIRLGYGPRLPEGSPELCFNYVLDETGARREFAKSRGFLFAREAMAVRILFGARFYDTLLDSAPWIGETLPRLYGSRPPSAGMPASDPVGWPIRLANLAIFPVLSTYLQLAGMLRNQRFRKLGQSDRVFTTRSSLQGLAFVSVRFERLRSRYDQAGREDRGRGPMVRGADGPKCEGFSGRAQRSDAPDRGGSSGERGVSGSQ